jgi:hypothetical protein
LKGLEMFFSKTVTLYKSHEIGDDSPADLHAKPSNTDQ